MKYFDSTKASTLVNSTRLWTNSVYDPATINTLFCPTEGPDINQRVGREVHVHGISIRASIETDVQANQTLQDSPAAIRVMLVQDTQTNAAQMLAADLMTAGASTNKDAIHAFENVNNLDRFKIYHDKIHILQNPNVAFDGTNMEQGAIIKYFEYHVEFKKPVIVRFNATNAGDITDIVDNSFHIVCNSSSLQLLPRLNYTCRTCYTDK